MSGIFGKVGNIENGEETLSPMAKVLQHRGPDDTGFHWDKRIALGCRLLRTRGPGEGRQPVSNKTKDVYAVLDGAIYNGDILRRKLEGSGYTFHLNSDAELLIHLYEEEGLDCVKRLRGHFAFAIWEVRSKRLVLARDHLGQKPLFYSETAEGLYFASEVKALSAVLSKSAEIDLESLDRYLSLRFIPGHGTMLQGIHKLPPAHYLVFDRSGMTLSRYWQLSFSKKVALSHDDYIEGLENKFQETVATHISTDGTGAFLSGGLDSSLIVAMMAREMKTPVPTFSIGFDEKEFDEIPYARIVSKTFGTHQIEDKADTDLIRVLPAIINGLGEPSDPVAASFFTASRLAAGHVKVALGGDGGNELFAGCDRYRGVLLANYYSYLPPFLRKAIISPLIGAIPSSFGYDSLQMKLRWFERMAGKQGVGERLAEAVSFFRFSQEEKELLLTKTILRGLEPGAAAKEISDRYYESDANDPIERMLYTDYCTRLPEHLLMLVDRMGMVHGLEVRSPLVDKELVEYMATFPLKMKIRGQKARYIWYQLAERLLPASIAQRKKRGFRFPLAYWFAVKLHSFLLRVFEDSCLAANGIFNRAYILRLLEEHRLRQFDHSWKIWILINLEIWYRMTIMGFNLEETEKWIAFHSEGR
ncbi:MAG: asparagine synthase (glutamine-hydrolyzing) [Nitrospiria bacterium]